MDSPCHCEVQGSSACLALPNTQCNADTGACECPQLYISASGKCFMQHVTDGLTLAPFILSSEGDTDWEATEAAPPNSDNAAFGISKNGYYLYAAGGVSTANKYILMSSTTFDHINMIQTNLTVFNTIFICILRESHIVSLHICINS